MGHLQDRKDSGEAGSSDPQPQAQEGVFDAQLMFPAPFVEPPPPLTAIVKRDGTTEPFDKRKIADAIFRAAETLDGHDRDRAESLASAVAIYLTKKLNGQIPTVDHVDDAVEKVLIEMGHSQTALAYARYRDRRARARTLQPGDLRTVLHEFEEGRRQREETRPQEASQLFVRTSGETLASWNRGRIVEALVRETKLDEAQANLIAIEVEQQIVAADVKTLTTSLVRELVSAKLVEHGLEEQHRRHMRLGVPLYDTERIIRGLSGDGGAVDPEATGRVLAEAVKREFALAQVFSPDVADGHVRGDLHIHDLSAVDRLHSCVQSLEYITRFGVGLRDTRTFSKPPKYADTVLAQMVHWSAALQNHFTGMIGWDAINVFFAPFLDGVPAKAIRQVAQMLVYEYAYRATVQGERAVPIEIGLCWDLPPHLKNAEAVEPGGVLRGRRYGDFVGPAQEFARAIFDVMREGGDRGAPFVAPTPVVHITPAFFKRGEHTVFLESAARAVLPGGTVHFVFDRDAPSQAEDASALWQPRDVVAQRVTLNLVRAAYRAHSERGLMTEIERLVAVAVRAHAQKAEFIAQLLSFEGLGPLRLLAVEREGRSHVNLHQAAYLVGVTGLNECVQYLTGYELHELDEAKALAMRLLAHLNDLCEHWSERLDLRCVPAQTADPKVNHRFAEIDLQEFPDLARNVIKSDPITHDLFYTPGTRLNASQQLSPIERVRLEGEFHCDLPTNAATLVRMPCADASQRSIVDFIQKTFHQTANRRVILTG